MTVLKGKLATKQRRYTIMKKDKKSRNKKKIQKPWNKQKIPGNHRIAFYRDKKSGHPYMRISRYGKYYYGHDMTTHPSLRTDKVPRRGYVRFRKNPNPSSKEKSYYHKSIRRLWVVNSNSGKRFDCKKDWVISNYDLRKLKRIDKKRIKNIRK